MLYIVGFDLVIIIIIMSLLPRNNKWHGFDLSLSTVKRLDE